MVLPVVNLALMMRSLVFVFGPQLRMVGHCQLHGASLQLDAHASLPSTLPPIPRCSTAGAQTICVQHSLEGFCL